jgi:dTDP-4-dehydrorhamnose 3,5-epimerase
MSYKVTFTPIEGVVELEPMVFSDARGYFFESFNAKEFVDATGVDRVFVQDNHSKSNKGVLRGLHYQEVRPQGKLVRVVSGEVFDVMVDIRLSSPTFGKWYGQYLSAENKKQIWIPEGLAHGFLVTSDYAEFVYKTTEYYEPFSEKTILWSDPFFNIDWPLKMIDHLPILSNKDANASPFQR